MLQTLLYILLTSPDGVDNILSTTTPTDQSHEDQRILLDDVDSISTLSEQSSEDHEKLLDEEFIFYSHLYSAITVIFAMAVLSKFLVNDFRFGFRSFLALVVLFVGEPVCELLLVSGPAGLVLLSLVCVTVYRSLPPSQLPAEGKSVLITGCDSGIGSALVKYMDDIGLTVFAGCLNVNCESVSELKKHCSSRLITLQMDVTNEHEISQAYQIVSEAVSEKGLWGVINNAGVCYMADLELTSDHILRRTLDINLHGTARCTHAFLPLLRRGAGRVINVSSLTGKVGMLCMGAYGISKAALEMYSEVLRLEMKRYNISVSVLRLGGFRTGSMDEATLKTRQQEMWTSLDADTRAYYGADYFSRIYKNFSAHVPSFPDELVPVCEAAQEALLSRSPSTHYNVGQGTSVVLGLYSMLPLSLRDRLVQACSVSAVTDIQPEGLYKKV